LEDRECTDRLTRAAKILGIRVLDHVVFGESDYFSFADAGILADMSGLNSLA
jgi:DNA repair protein RadC